jgi:hypothetical protein
MSTRLQDWVDLDAAAVQQTPLTDRRHDLRHVTVLQVAKLITDRCEELCIVRDLSEGGVRVQVYCDIAEHERVRIQFKSGHQVGGHVAWTEDHVAGIAFDERVDISELLARRDTNVAGHHVRAPRIRCDLTGMVRIDGDQILVQLCDISQDGCKVQSEHMLRPWRDCEISLPGLGFRFGTVRWFRDGHAGIRLHTHLTYAEFAHWRQRLLANRL